MKKLFLSVLTIMLVLAIVLLPTSVNAATIESDKTEMNVGDVVKLTITTDNDVESMQFDVKFDSSKYQYINDSAESKLGSTDSGLVANDIVRVSAFNLNSEETDVITLSFRATAEGQSVPFAITGLVELGNSGETFANPQIEVAKIGPAPATEDGFVNDQGEKVKEHARTGKSNSSVMKVITAVTMALMMI